MIKLITPEQLRPDMKLCYDGWLDYFKKSIDSQLFVPYTDFHGEDKNLLAWRSKEDFISWYGRPPGKIAEPYRDDCFYTRELTWLSMWCQPKTVVEFGTDKGIGTFILKRMNPNAMIYTVDINDKVKMPGDQYVETGFFALDERNIVFERQDSKNFKQTDVQLCFIDGDHSQDAVWNDSLRAWANRPNEGRWVIIWHDYREGSDDFGGLRMAINRFSDLVRKKVCKFEDSSTVWMYEDPNEA